MAIDITVPQSPGWWIARLSRKLWERERINHLLLMRDWHRGEPPLPLGPEEARDAFRRVQEECRLNFARLLVESLAQRVIPIGIRSADAAADAEDPQAANIWQRSGAAVTWASLRDSVFSEGFGYLVVGDKDLETGVPTITYEDARHAVSEQDPAMPWRSLAGLKFKHDFLTQQDMLYLYLPGEIWIASRPCTSDPYGSVGSCVESFEPALWIWVNRPAAPGVAPVVDGRQALPAQLAKTVIMVEFENKDRLGEFQPHLSVLRRIHRTILSRMVIVLVQAHRQRAFKGLPTHYPDDYPVAELRGKEIDYEGVFVHDPGAAWQLPADTDIWESGQLDLSPILNSVKDDVTFLAAVSQRPVHVLMPDNANQSAEGASVGKEGLVGVAEDRIDRFSPRLARAATIANLWMGMELPEATVLPSQIEWMSPERYSLSERADAASKATDVPWRTKMIKFFGFTPEEVDRMQSERVADQMLAHMSIRLAGQAGTPATLAAAAGGNPLPTVPALPALPPGAPAPAPPQPAPAPAPQPAAAGTGG